MFAPLPGFMALYRASDSATAPSAKPFRLGLTGYARNMDDGSVEVVACGEADRVEKLVAWLKAGGPRSARVDKVLTEPHQPDREYADFSIRY